MAAKAIFSFGAVYFFLTRYFGGLIYFRRLDNIQKRLKSIVRNFMTQFLINYYAVRPSFFFITAAHSYLSPQREE